MARWPETKMRISATVITFNEEENISAALESLSWADEIIVVDSESADHTVEIARRYTDRVFVRPWPGYSDQKNFAADQARNDWIFSLDADERVSENLAREIAQLNIDPGAQIAGFEMPRLTNYLGLWIRHSGWYPDYKLRLYDRKRGRWRGHYVHESLQADGEIKRLNGDLLHHTVRDVSEHHLRIDRYTTLAAEQMHSEGKRSSLLTLLFTPMLTFFRSYVVKLGFLDGARGLAIAYFAAHYTFLRALKLWEKETSNKREGAAERSHESAGQKRGSKSATAKGGE
jgi:glycosyltransferase involved in cell wall biosynthesis